MLIGSVRNHAILDETAEASAAGQVLSHYLDQWGPRTRRDRAPLHRVGSDHRQPYQLVVGSNTIGYSQGDWTDWFALASDVTTANAEVDVYCQWARGDVFAWIVHGPNGEPIASCEGYYQLHDAEPDWRAAIEHHEAELRARASTTGAGFIEVL